MKRTKVSNSGTRRKATAKRYRTKFAIASINTIWAIATNWAAAFVTLSIHTKGAPENGERPCCF